MRTTSFGLLLIASLTVSCKVSFKKLPNEDNIYNLTTEAQLQDIEHLKTIEDFYKNGIEDYFTGIANVPIYYKIFQQADNESPAILISSGRTEAAIKYKELIFDLFKNGYSIYIHDHRGQGLSGRITENPEMGYIDTFQFYIDDMKYFYDSVLSNGDHQKKYLLAHSMGGAIGITYLEQYPNDFDAAAFSSPMLGFKSPTCLLAKILTGDEIKYAVGQTDYEEDKLIFDENKLTGSEIRYNITNKAYADDKQARLGGVAYQWVYKSCQQYDYIFDNIENIETPFLLFSADSETVVDPKAHQRFIEKVQKLGKACEAYLIENAQHELFVEKDAQRIKTINQVFRFFEKHN